MNGYEWIYCAKCGECIQNPYMSDTTAVPVRTVTTYKQDGTKTEKYYCLFCNPKEEE